MRQYINKLLITGIMACMLLGGLVFTSCDKDDAEVTTVQLKVFGPSPALRGGELKFVGVNLDKVTTVVLQPNIQVSDFVSKKSDEIVITIPQEATPGKVTLKTSQGDISTITPLTFTEPISIASFSPATAKAGDVVTINGDYLNLIAEVIFTEGVVVKKSDFISQSRKKIEVKVPVAAQSGKMVVSNGAEMPVLVYTATPLTVTLPVVTAVSPNPVKPGQELKITGTNFQLVKSVVFPDGLKVEDFTVSSDKTQITVIVPAEVKEGNLKLVAFSGVEVNFATALNLIAPVVSGVEPAQVKNGENLTINGTNLDLVTDVTFADGSVGTVVSRLATKLEVAVPLTATDGKVVLGTKSGKSVEAGVITTVKPTITSMAPLALMAGNDITIAGTNLDLVRKVTFVGGLSVDVTPQSATSLKVTVPPAAVGTGAVVLTTTNGTQISSTEQLSIEAANKPVITSIDASVKPGAKLTIKGTKLHLVEAIYFQSNVKAVLYGVRTETSIEVYVPETAKKGQVTLKLVSFAGDEIVSPEFTVSGTDPVLDPSYVFFNFDGKNSWWGDKGAVENKPELSLDGSNYFRVNDDMKPDWNGFFWRNSRNDLKIDGVTINSWAVKIDVNVLADISGDLKFRLKGSDGDFWSVIHGLKNKGGWYTVTLPLTSFIIDKGTAVLPNMANIDSDFGMAYTGSGEHVNMCIDNVRFEKISAGAAGSRGFKLTGF